MLDGWQLNNFKVAKSPKCIQYTFFGIEVINHRSIFENKGKY